jgi:hypothetical protein
MTSNPDRPTKNAKRKPARKGKPHGEKQSSRRFLLPFAVTLLVVVIVVGVGEYLLFGGHTNVGHSSTTATSSKPVILFENQENSPVNQGNFGNFVDFARSNGFNTIFFQISYKGSLLACCNDISSLKSYVTGAHVLGVKIFFVLSFSNSSQGLPSSFIYSAGEDGIDLDMSTLPYSNQQTLLSSLKGNFSGTTAVTTYNFTTTLKPNWLIFETYNWPSDQQYLSSRVIGSVEVVAASDNAQYRSWFLSVLSGSAGVMVFDYSALKNYGYSTSSTT